MGKLTISENQREREREMRRANDVERKNMYLLSWENVEIVMRMEMKEKWRTIGLWEAEVVVSVSFSNLALFQWFQWWCHQLWLHVLLWKSHSMEYMLRTDEQPIVHRTCLWYSSSSLPEIFHNHNNNNKQKRERRRWEWKSPLQNREKYIWRDLWCLGEYIKKKTNELCLF